MQDIYTYFIKFHVIFSIFFLLIAIFITVNSFLGWILKKKYTNFVKYLKYTFLIFLYADLFLGVILYFFLKKPDELITVKQAVKFAELRFWAVLHFSNMIFIVILSQIGSIFIKKTSDNNKKYKYSFIYFGTSTLIILISIGIFALKK